MVYAILIAVHIIVCVFLILVVLIQAGRGGGLAESFSGAESIFGTKTNTLLTRATTFFAVSFFITCLSLAILSRQRSTSLIKSPLPQPSSAKTETPPAAKKQPLKTENKEETQKPPAPETKEETAAKTQIPESQQESENKTGN